MNNDRDINWSEVAAEVSHLVRPETRSKYFPTNPLRQMIIGRFLENISRELSGFSWEQLLDVGCGEGFVDYYVSRVFPGRSVIGVDLDLGALEAARIINPGFEYLETDCRRLPFADDAFDAVICMEMLEHVSFYPEALAEIGRVTRGPVVVSVPCWPWYQGINFALGKNWSRWGEHPDHVAQFRASTLRKDLESALGGSVKIQTSFPWLIGVCSAVG